MVLLQLDKEGYICELFDTIAPYYDLMNKIMTWGLLNSWQKQFLQQTDLQKGNKVLDLCTGTGNLAYLLAEKVGLEGEVIGIDFSSKMLQRAERKKQKRKIPVQFIKGNVLTLPLPAEYFDCVTMGFALRNVDDIKGALKEMKRVLKSGGKLVLMEISEPNHYLIRKFFSLYFYHFIPCLGRLGDKGRKIRGYYPAYTWLAQSVRTFPSPEKITSLLKEEELTHVFLKPLSAGMVNLYGGRKA